MTETLGRQYVIPSKSKVGWRAHRMQPMYRWYGMTVLIISLVFSPTVLHAQVTTQITPSTGATSTATTASTLGTTTTIAGGNANGANLFHSFDRFDLASGRTADYQVVPSISHGNIENVISRVLGSGQSYINGTLKMSVTATGSQTTTNPAFYFMNSNGVVFGSGATLDLPGAFHVGAASQLVDSSGNAVFSSSSLSTMTHEAPEEFGLLGDGKTIKVAPSSSAGTSIDMSNTHDISIYADQVKIQNATLKSQRGITITGKTTTSSTLYIGAGSIINTSSSSSVSGGDITISNFDTVTIDARDINGNRFNRDGGIIKSSVSGSGAGYGEAGSIEITANDVSIQGGAKIESDNEAINTSHSSVAANGRGIVFNVKTLKNKGFNNSGTIYKSLISSSTTGNVDAGGVTINGITGSGSFAELVLVSDDAILQSNTKYDHAAHAPTTVRNSGNAGEILINADEVKVNSGGGVQAYSAGGTTHQNNTGRAGNITVDTRYLLVDANYSASARYVFRSATDYKGNAGKIKIKNSRNGNTYSSTGPIGSDNLDTVHVTNSAQITTYGLNWGANAGSVIIEDMEKVQVDNAGKITSDVSHTAVGGCPAACTLVGDAGLIIIRNVNDLVLDGANSEISSNINGRRSRVLTGVRKAGEVVIAAENVKVYNSAKISSKALGGDNANPGGVAGSVTIVGKATPVGDDASLGTITKATNVTLAEDSTSTTNTTGGGSITASIDGNAVGDETTGNITIHSDALIISNGGKVATEASKNTSGATNGLGESSNAGTINLDLGALTMSHAGTISSNSSSSGSNAGSIEVEANTISLSGASKIVSETRGLGNAGLVKITKSGNSSGSQVTLDGGSQISSSTYTVGNAGVVQVTGFETITVGSAASSGGGGQISSASCRLNGGVADDCTTETAALSGTAGQVVIGGETVNVNAGGAITSASNTNANAGSVTIGGDGTTLSSGTVTTNTANVINIDGGEVSTSAKGSGASIAVAGNIVLDTKELTVSGTSAKLESSTKTSGNAGSVEIKNSGVTGTNVLNSVTLSDGGEISTSTSGSGNATDITLHTKVLTMNTGKLFSSTSSSGNAGKIAINGVNGAVVEVKGGSHINTESIGTGLADNIVINSGIKSIRVSGVNSVIKASAGENAQGSGDVLLNALEQIEIQSGGKVTAETKGAGNAGLVRVESNDIMLDAGEISSSTFGSGNAGQVEVVANRKLDVRNRSRIITSSNKEGKAGNIKITGKDMNMEYSRRYDEENSVWGMSQENDGEYGILSTTNGKGDAGLISIRLAGNLRMIDSSIAASTGDSASGNAGKIEVSVGGDIYMDPSYISSSNSGSGDAGDVNVDIGLGSLELIHSGIMTSAQKGNGGSIVVNVGNELGMTDALITTSVFDRSGVGRGGDIDVNTNVLTMVTGFIQANTVAQGASGGDVVVKANQYSLSGNSLFRSPRSGYTFTPGVFGLNVIQSSSETGSAGNVETTVNTFDDLAALTGLSGDFLDASGIGKDVCSIGATSSLTLLGRGGLPDSFDDFVHYTPKYIRGLGQ